MGKFIIKLQTEYSRYITDLKQRNPNQFVVIGIWHILVHAQARVCYHDQGFETGQMRVVDFLFLV